MKTLFWRGFGALLLAFAAGQLGPQLDLALLAHAGQGVSGLYVLVTRLAILELVITLALGASLSVLAARGERSGQPGEGLRPALLLAAGVGLPLGLLGGLAGYLLLPRLLSGDPGQVVTALAALPWFFVAAPLRLLNGCAAFLLHARGEGPLALRCKAVELLARLLLGVALIQGLGMGLGGCFITGLLLNLGTALWLTRHLARASSGQPWWPRRDWRSQALRGCAWESQRLLAIQAFGLLAVALFAAERFWPPAPGRLDAFSSALTLALLVFAPLSALLRFLSMRLAASPAETHPEAIRQVTHRALPVAVAVAALLALSVHRLGALYGQAGPWWTTYVLILAVSLPVRVLGNLRRAQRQAAGQFALVGRLDAGLLWLIGLPTLLAGLAMNSPLLAYVHLLLPELCILAALQRAHTKQPEFC